ncbi:hypothetical protein ALI22I_06820 [Saccharothrix sp. ALI-22-I]|uniref:hypothetical protein n=1 Tax=Saccharothrix sp. ALI-22-I TaxID=1933778 RepID=UPI00097BEB7B|nr:hypothetical protein [Saccharothrix sp. ALI-22-I]ONI91951.1 hypothetical protein ALI22I_06820 [Saccharothrix sp. ALI-22-I]
MLDAAAFTVTLFPTVKPKLTPTEVVTLVGMAADGTPAPGFTVRDQGGSAECFSASIAVVGDDLVSCSPSAAGADVCWVGPDRRDLVCDGMPWEKTITLTRSDAPVPPATKVANPTPWGLELANGAKCRLRNGGSWDGRADDYVGAYYCPDHEPVLVKASNEATIDTPAPCGRCWSARWAGPMSSSHLLSASP